jgi:hypothetical protein
MDEREAPPLGDKEPSRTVDGGMAPEDERGAPPPPPEIEPEVPEADALEQRMPALPEDTDDEPTSIPPEAPEADVLEQSRSVPVDDSEPRG